MPKTKATFGQRVRELRLAADLTQQQLADRAKINRVHLTYIEGGRQGRNPSYETVRRLAEALGVGPEKLF